MSRRRVEKLKPFAFSADFSAGPADSLRGPGGDTVEIAPQELAALGARLYADAAANAQQRLDAEAGRRLEDAVARMEAAVAALHELTGALDRLGRAGELPANLSALSEQAARALIDGQGDLFAARECLLADGAGQN